MVDEPQPASREDLLAYRGLAHLSFTLPDGTEELFYNPTPRQDAFHLCEAPYALFGGAAGGGKSHALRMDAYMRCFAQPGYRALLLRRTYPELNDTHIERVLLEEAKFRSLGLGVVFQKTDYKLRFANGSLLQFGHCEDDATLSKYLSTEYDAAYFDEASTFLENHFLWIGSRVRSTKPGVAAIIRCGSNPGGIGALWLKRRFIDKDIRFEEDEAYDPKDYVFIQSRLTDNPHLGDDYRKRLLSLPSPALRRAYLYGDWSVFEGQEFEEFRTHDAEGQPWHVVEELPTIDGKTITEVPWVETFRALDWGYGENGVCLWFCCLPDGRLLVFQEWVFKGVITSKAARTIKEMSRGLRVRYTAADPRMWTKEAASGESMAETFAKNGVPLVKADNDRMNGWQRVHAWLTETAGEQQRPLIQFYRPGCPYLIRTLPIQTSDPKKPGDVLTKGVEDHAADALRYGLMSRPAPSLYTPRKVVVPGSIAHEVQRWLRQQRRGKPLGAESVRR